MKTFSIEEAVKHGWTLFKAHKKILILAALIFLVISSFSKGGENHHGGFGNPIAWLVLSAVSILVQIGWYKILLHVEDGEPTSLHEFFKHTELFWKYLGTGLVYGIMAAIGLVLFIIPGIYLLVKYSFAPLIIVDRKDLSIRQAFDESARLTDGIKWKLLGFGAALFLLNVLGVACLVVGVLVSMPVTMLAHIHVYRILSQNTPKSTLVEPQSVV